MQTRFSETILATREGARAEEILRSCVHCGFCNATCPTYQILGDELDGPRGRIYLIKQMLESGEVHRSTQQHLDRCLTCLNCETTCPSGVDYSQLLDIGRHHLEQHQPRPWREKWLRKMLRMILPYPNRFAPLLRIGQVFRLLLPGTLKTQLPARSTSTWNVPPVSHHQRRMLLLQGCVLPSLSPATNHAAVQVFDRLGIRLETINQAGCCGAISQHLGAAEEAKDFIRRNIDAWWPEIEQGIEAVVVTASGCGVMVKDYGHLLADDPLYTEKARRISELAKDPCEILANEDLSSFRQPVQKSIAFHPPCTLQHGQQLQGKTEKLLQGLGFELLPVHDGHLCCGSAGTYSLLQPQLSQQLKSSKLQNLLAHQPALIATANIGCQKHLQSGTAIPVVHWLELLLP